MTIPFIDLKHQYAQHRAAFDDAMCSVCESASFILGPAVARFEKQFAEYLGAAEAVGVASGTDALRLACRAVGLESGDEVLIPANTFIATAVAVHEAAATPVPVDVASGSFQLDLEDAERRVTEKTRAVMPVHLFGQAVDMDAVLAFAERLNLAVIEDACQAHGAAWNGKRVGGLGAVGCFSFYPGKNLGAFGDGGMVVTNDAAIAEKLRQLRNYGSVEKHVHHIVAGNSRLDSLQAAVLSVKMAFLDDWNRRRFDAACRYTDTLQDLDAVTAPVFDRSNPNAHVFHLFVIQCDRRDDLMAFLLDRDIGCGIHYPVPVHRHPAFAHLGCGPGTCPVAERLAAQILSLPMFPEITDAQVDAVVAAIKAFYG